MTGLPPRRFPAPPGVALGGKVQLRGNNVGNLSGRSEKREEKKKRNPNQNKQLKLPSRSVALRPGRRETSRCPAAPGVPRSRCPRWRGPPPSRGSAGPAARRGAERRGGRKRGRVAGGPLACYLRRRSNAELGRVSCRRVYSRLYAGRGRKEAEPGLSESRWKSFALSEFVW